MITLLIICAYLLLTLGIGIYSYRVSEANPEDYFLAGRNVGPVVLFFTLVATNFSAFFFLGFAGRAYRIGYTFYASMAFGTALVALAFYFIGHRSWQLGKARGYITPPEMIGDIFQSKALKTVYLLVMVFFTLPYLAIQPYGAGILFNTITDGVIAPFTGAVILSVVIVGYVFLGGMRSVAITDVVQGVIMFALMFIAVYVVGEAYGGFAEANRRVYQTHPELFSRAGTGGFFTPKTWFSAMILWILAVPMFPQMFMRFFISDSSRSLQISARLYPVVTALLFLCPVAIGVMGHLLDEELTGKAVDFVLPQVLAATAPEWLAALVMVGALAAFMSTMDSQLLAMSSMLVRDIYLGFFDTEVTLSKQVQIGKLLIIILTVFGLALAYDPPATITGIVTQTFTGLAILFPTTIAALYWPRATAAGCISSILVGEAILLGLYFGLIPPAFNMGFMPVVPVVALSAIILVVVSLAGKRPDGRR